MAHDMITTTQDAESQKLSDTGLKTIFNHGKGKPHWCLRSPTDKVNGRQVQASLTNIKPSDQVAICLSEAIQARTQAPVVKTGTCEFFALHFHPAS